MSEQHGCPYCARAFTRPDYRDLHLGLDHADRLTPEEEAAYEDASDAEREELRMFRYKALAALVVIYFGFIMVYAFVLAG